MASSFVGCSDDELLFGGEPPPDIVWQGAHLEVGTDLDLEAWCPGNLARMDDFAGSLKSLFGAPPDLLIAYYLFEPGTQNCQGGYSRCTYSDRGIVVTTVMQDDHELVHAVSGSLGGLPHVFEEGAATFWGDATTLGSVPVEELPEFRELLDDDWDGGLLGRDYAVAADFIAYLADTYPGEYFWALSREASGDQARSDFEDTFSKAYGLAFDDAVAEYEAAWVSCAPIPVRSGFFECAKEPVATLGDGSPGVVNVDVSCADPNTLGPRADREGESRIWQDVTLEVLGDSPRTFRTVFEEPEDWSETMSSVQVEVKSCDRSCVLPGVHAFFPEPKYNLPDPDPNVFELSPGRYTLRVSRAADEPGPVRFRFESIEGM